MACYADQEKYPLFSAVQAAFMVDQDAYDAKGTVFFDCPPFETGGRRIERVSVKSYEYELGFITKKGIKSFRVKGTVKEVKNLYIASQWIMAPGGLLVAVTAGKFAVWRIKHSAKSPF